MTPQYFFTLLIYYIIFFYKNQFYNYKTRFILIALPTKLFTLFMAGKVGFEPTVYKFPYYLLNVSLKVVGIVGFEPTAFPSQAERSTKLSYTPKLRLRIWCAYWGSNPGYHD